MRTHTTAHRTAVVLAVGGTLVAGAAGIAGATPSPAPAVRHSGHIFFEIGGTVTDQQVIMHGVLTAAGKDDSAHDGYDVLTFKHGSFRVVHPDAQATFVPVVDNKTCYATFTEKGTFTLSHGKGSYVNIKGSGRYTASGKALLKRTKSGACDLNSEPKAELFTVHAAGKLT